MALEEEKNVRHKVKKRPSSPLVTSFSSSIRTIRMAALGIVLGTSAGNFGCQAALPRTPIFAENDAKLSEWGVELPPDHEIEGALRENFKQTSVIKGLFFEGTQSYEDIQRIHTARREKLQKFPYLKDVLPPIVGLDFFAEQIDPDVLKKLIEKFIHDGFPKGWFSKATMEKIQFMPLSKASIKPGTTYDGIVLDGTTIHYSDGRTEVLLDTGSERKKIGSFIGLIDAIGHEGGHNNASRNSPFLTNQQGNQLLYVFFKQLYTPGRPVFGYVEELIKNSGQDMSLEELSNIKSEFETIVVQMAFCDEWWNIESHDWQSWKTNLTKAFIDHNKTDPAVAKYLTDVVSHYISQIDPEFKPWEGVRVRLQVKDELKKKWKK